MKKLNHALLMSVSLILMAFTAQAQSPRPSQQAPSDLHPFYTQMHFVGGTFQDPKNAACERGFIGWVTSEDGVPELVYIQDVFRKIQLHCTQEDFKKGGVSCLSKNKITYSHQAGGKTYRSVLTLARPNVLKPVFRLERLVDGEQSLLCNYHKIL